MVMGELDIGPISDTPPTKEEIVGVKLQEKVVGLKRSTIITCSMLKKNLMAFGEIDLGLRQDLLPSIIKLIMVDHLIFLVWLITEVGIGLTPENFLHITMVD